MSAPLPAEHGTMAVVRSSRSLAALLRVAERRAIHLANRARVSRTSAIAAALWVLVFVVVVLVVPRPTRETRTIELPEERVIVLEPKPLQPTAPQQLPIEKLQVRAATELPEGLVSEPEAIPDRRIPRLAPDAGQLGRKRAEEATRALAAATRSVDQALAGLSSSLKNSSRTGPDAQRGAASVRGGRADGDVRGGPALASSGASSAGKAVQGSRVVIEAPGPVAATDAGPEGEGQGVSLGEPPGIYRSNASLLGVIQRYAPGIQFCYENELKRKSHLGGKLVVSITVAAAGEVIEARVVNDGVGSPALASCALAQIRDWKFPPIRRGLTTFQTPFVFTPPN
jgi:TonB family protein